MVRLPSVTGFRAQVALISIASLSVVSLAAVLIWDVVSSTEQVLTAEARQQCLSACRELARQYGERLAYGEPLLGDLPIAAQDVSLQGLTTAVLRSYDGVTGGFFDSAAAGILGYAAIQEISEFERIRIAGAVQRAGRAEESADVIEEGRDLVVVATRELPAAGLRVWSSRRLVGIRDPVLRQRRWWPAALVISALLGVGGVISISMRLRGGVASMQEGLARLESDFSFRLPQLSSEFGGIAKAINQMAERRVALEEGLRRQDRLSALGRAVGGVAHEIRNPLNSIRLTLELLERRLRRGAVTADEVAAAIKEVDRLDLILSRLLAFGRPELLDRHVQDVQPLIERACRMVDQPRREKNIEIRVDVEPDMRADVDGPQIEQVMINLLLNAVEASPPESPVAVHASRRNSHVHIAVEDRGPGVPEHARDHLFDAYFTTKENGNGLGLAVSREIVAQHGGQLSFEQTDAGAVFLIRLPVERSA